MTAVDKEAIQTAYEDVRNDGSDTMWAVFKFEGKGVIVDATGTDYSDFQSKFTDDDRAFGFVRVITGDELSRRAKFVLISWCGQNVSPLKRAKMSTDKTEMKKLIQSVAVEIQTSEQEEIEESYVRNEVIKAGGANYGTGE